MGLHFLIDWDIHHSYANIYQTHFDQIPSAES